MGRAPCDEYSETVGSVGRAGVVQLLQVQIWQTQRYSSIQVDIYGVSMSLIGDGSSESDPVATC